jgi:cell division protein ZapA
MKNLVRIEILGHEYTVKSDEGDERVKKITDYVNRKVQEISENSKNIPNFSIAILTALNIAKDYFDLLEAQQNLTEEIENQSVRLIQIIDSQIH